MKTPFVLAAALLAIAFTSPAASADAPEASEKCVEYLYVADYHWYYVCVDPQGGACAVYFKERHGMTVKKECPLPAITEAPPRCVLVARDLDYSHYACWDASDPRCAAYLMSTDGSTERRFCYGDVLPVIGSGAGATCIPTSGGLDYPSWLCVDPSNPKCAVYTITTSDWGVKKTCVPGAVSG